MSHALLLRLFLSPSFFSVTVALQYLTIYHENIGITYYLTRRLREFDINELRDVWGFICHLLVSRPSKSRALESFVVDISEQSSHMAMFTLWFMQAHLRDLSLSRKDSKSFKICQRVLHRCHEIIFDDVPGLTTGPYASIKVPSKNLPSRRRVKHHIHPAVIGMSVLLAGSPGMPNLAGIIGPVAIEQGRESDDVTLLRSVEQRVEDGGSFNRGSAPVLVVDEEEDEDSADQNSMTNPEETEHSVSKDKEDGKHSEKGRGTLPPSLALRRKSNAAAKTTPSFSAINGSPIRHSEATDDPFGQQDFSSSKKNRTKFQSSPVITATSRRGTNSASGNVLDLALQEYDQNAQQNILRSHYCRSEVQFVLGLENISNRLLVIPKPARVSALRAELTTINHKLPAELCMPLWCPGFESLSNRSGKPTHHHRIVRIPPGECVVLNSAERAPFLLYIEILKEDLDFDPSKRNNKQLLKDIIRRKFTSTRSLDEDSSIDRNIEPKQTPQPEISSAADEAINSESGDMSNGVFSDETIDSPTTKSSDGDEEMDLVEQVYGDNYAINPSDLSETFVLPTQPKNRDLDVATWSRSASLQASPAMTPSVSQYSPKSSHGNAHASTTSGSLSRPPVLSLDDYSERMRTAAVMLAQLNSSLTKDATIPVPRSDANFGNSVPNSVDPGGIWNTKFWLLGMQSTESAGPLHPSLAGAKASRYGPLGASQVRLQASEVSAIRERIMQEMLSLEEERMERMRVTSESEGILSIQTTSDGLKTAEDEQIIRRELNKADPSAVVFQESWAAKKSRIRQGSPYGHLASWDCVSVIVKTGADLRQEQLAVQLIREFEEIWRDEDCPCFVRPFQILITGGSSGLVETITDAVSVHSIKKALYARRLTEGRLGQVTLLDHFINTFGDPSSAKFARAQRNFIRSLAGYSIITYLLQIKDRHNGNILLDRDGHMIHIDFGFMLSNSPGNIGFEAAPFKLTFDYVEIMGGVDSPAFRDFKRLFHEGFEAARKHCDRIVALVEIMQKDSTLPCFAALGEQTAQQLRDRFQSKSSQSTTADYVERLIVTSLGSNWTRLYDSYQYYSQSIL